ncbi:unnamed protein product [Didymodactylos carnosus]|uniref:Integrase catalytic domain-containing protein n=1 Tax=Didymodactylos carnosus TaxID=1234261 RepID=A0A8S2WIM6_9BILA|nr:unnamed protein product [Didymodactylos carnosus]
MTRLQAKQLNIKSTTIADTCKDDKDEIDSGANDPMKLSNLLIDFDMDRIKQAQTNDVIIQEKIEKMKNGMHKSDMTVVDDVLYKLVIRNGAKEKIRLPWIPHAMIQELLRAFHDHPMSGHFGVRRTWYKIKQHYYWPKMFETVQSYVRSCEKCTKFNIKRNKSPGFLQPIPPPEGAFDVVHMDFWGPSPVETAQGNRYVLVFTDNLSKYVLAETCPTNTVKTAAQVLLEKIIMPHGNIKYLMSDQGSHFNNDLIRALTSLLGIKQSFSIPYHPPIKRSSGKIQCHLL